MVRRTIALVLVALLLGDQAQLRVTSSKRGGAPVVAGAMTCCTGTPCCVAPHDCSGPSVCSAPAAPSSLARFQVRSESCGDHRLGLGPQGTDPGLACLASLITSPSSEQAAHDSQSPDLSEPSRRPLNPPPRV